MSANKVIVTIFHKISKIKYFPYLIHSRNHIANGVLVRFKAKITEMCLFICSMNINKI